MSVTISGVKVICTAPEGINLVVVKVETNQPGLYGLGCATFAYRHLTVRHLVEEYLEPLLVGRDAENIEELWQLMHQNAYWRNGPIENNAISGVDMALWDIKGKMANMPLYQLFGGKVREGVPVYRHVDGKDIEEICDNILRFQEMGITHLRCQCGGYGGAPYGQTPKTAPAGAHDGMYLDSRQYIRDTVKLFEQIRSRIGYDMQLIHDVHERIAPIDAIRLAKELEPFDLFYLEEPVPLEQINWLRNLRRQTSIDIVTCANSVLTQWIPEMAILDQPYLFTNEAQAHAAVDGPVGGLIEREALELLNLHVVGYMESGFRNVFSINPVTEMDNFHGMKIRTMQNAYHMAAFKSFGAIPTSLAAGEQFTALQQGTIDACENAISNCLNNGFYEITKHITYTNHAFVYIVVSMSDNAWNNIPEELRPTVLEAIERGYNIERELLKQANENATVTLRDTHGVTFHEIDVPRLQEAYHSLAEQRGYTFDPEWQAAIDEAIAANP